MLYFVFRIHSFPNNNVLFVTVCYCLLLFVTKNNCLLLFVTVCYCLLLKITERNSEETKQSCNNAFTHSKICSLLKVVLLCSLSLSLSAVMEGPLVVEATPTPLLAVGRSLILTCRLSTSADPTRNNVPPSLFRYTWTHNGSSNLSPRAARVEGGRRLVISHIQVEDSGVYHCSVDSKPAPTAISALINVTVEGKILSICCHYYTRRW